MKQKQNLLQLHHELHCEAVSTRLVYWLENVSRVCSPNEIRCSVSHLPGSHVVVAVSRLLHKAKLAMAVHLHECNQTHGNYTYSHVKDNHQQRYVLVSLPNSLGLTVITPIV
jgi:hypothetical protein